MPYAIQVATVGHLAMGLCGARLHHRRRPTLVEAALWSALSFLPDADVGAFAYVAYSHALGHRGAAHSFAFAAATGALVGVGAYLAGAPRRALRLASFVALVVASHGLLDAMTDGGLGIGLLWPFDDHRYWAPWRPLPVAPFTPGSAISEMPLPFMSGMTMRLSDGKFQLNHSLLMSPLDAVSLTLTKTPPKTEPPSIASSGEPLPFTSGTTARPSALQ